MDFIGIEVAVDNGACTTCTESSSSNCSLGIGKTATLSDAVGVGTIGMVDFDVVDVSNLQRQILFGVDQEGKSKLESAKERLVKLNPHTDYILN